MEGSEVISIHHVICIHIRGRVEGSKVISIHHVIFIDIREVMVLNVWVIVCLGLSLGNLKQSTPITDIIMS